jgi:hypothetical protein
MAAYLLAFIQAPAFRELEAVMAELNHDIAELRAIPDSPNP